MRYDHRHDWMEGDCEAEIDIRLPNPPSAASDLLATSPAVIAFVLLAVTLVVDAILGFVSVLFAATILLIFVSFILWLICGAITMLFCGVGAIISLIGALCSIRRPPALCANLSALLANAVAFGLASWLMAELLGRFR